MLDRAKHLGMFGSGVIDFRRRHTFSCRIGNAAQRAASPDPCAFVPARSTSLPSALVTFSFSYKAPTRVHLRVQPTSSVYRAAFAPIPPALFQPYGFVSRAPPRPPPPRRSLCISVLLRGTNEARETRGEREKKRNQERTNVVRRGAQWERERGAGAFPVRAAEVRGPLCPGFVSRQSRTLIAWIAGHAASRKRLCFFRG